MELQERGNIPRTKPEMKLLNLREKDALIPEIKVTNLHKENLVQMLTQMYTEIQRSYA